MHLDGRHLALLITLLGAGLCLAVLVAYEIYSAANAGKRSRKRKHRK